MRTIAYGYTLTDGKAVVEPTQAKHIQDLFEAFLSEKGLMAAIRKTGFPLTHSQAALILENPRYIGDGFYPAIVPAELFEQVKAKRRTQRQTKKRNPKCAATRPIPTLFSMRMATKTYEEPEKQAEYLYSLIESEETTWDK